MAMIEWIVWHQDPEKLGQPPRELGRIHSETKRQAVAKATQRYVVPFWVQSVVSHSVDQRSDDLEERFRKTMRYWNNRRDEDEDD